VHFDLGEGPVESGPTSGPWAQIVRIDLKSPAELAGFQAGDRVIRANDEEVCSPYRLLGIVQSWPEGTEMSFEIQREDQLVKLSLKLPRLEFIEKGPVVHSSP
jgi:S1-C subfamily serine protease